MKMSIKRLLPFTILSLLFFTNCKKEDVVTYELTLNATKSQNGSTTFTEIKYMDGNKAAQTITNLATDFSTKFVITESSLISFSVKGTASGGTPTALPTPIVSYKVEKVTNGTKREDMCNELESSIKGSGGTYTFEKVFSKVFSGADCK